LKNLAVAIDEAEDTLEEVFEPWLIREGFLARTPQGRVILPLGRDALGLAPLPEGDSAS
jgi:Holliday junction DNA helicase RuvB